MTFSIQLDCAFIDYIVKNDPIWVLYSMVQAGPERGHVAEEENEWASPGVIWLLTEFDEDGQRNIWLSVQTHRPQA